jgi:chromosomal replication initiator protein
MPRPVLTIADIMAATAAHYGLTMTELRSSCRKRAVALPRQVSGYLCREFTDRSFTLIGHRHARDHTTMIHAYWKIARLLETDPALAADVDAIRATLKNRSTEIPLPGRCEPGAIPAPTEGS